MTTSVRRRSHAPALDGLRGTAVLLVMAYHAQFPSWFVGDETRPLFVGGWIGVDVFFVLSGYLITSGLLSAAGSASGLALGAFYRRRLARLGPAVAVLLVVWLILASVGAIPVRQLGRVGRHHPAGLAWVPVKGLLTLRYNSWLAVDKPSPTGMGHLWSLTIEEQFYLVWPVVIWLLFRRLRRPKTALRLTAFTTFIVSLSLRANAVAHGNRDWAYFSTPTRMLGLVVGALLALYLPSHQSPQRSRSRLAVSRTLPAAAVAMLTLMAVTIVDNTPRAVPVSSVVTVLCVAVIIAALVLDGSLARWFGWRWLRWCGRRSYALYLWDAPVVFVCQHSLHPGWRAALVSTVVTFGLAVASWHLVERRFLTEGRRAEPEPAVALPALATVPAQR